MVRYKKFISISTLFIVLIIFTGCSNTPKELTKQYLLSDTLEKRASYVVDSQKDVFISYYQGIIENGAKISFKQDAKEISDYLHDIRFANLDKIGNVKEADYSTISVNYNDEKLQNTYTNIWYWIKTKDGFKLDWETTVGYNNELFGKTSTRSPQIFRVIAEKDDYYNWEFRGQENSFYSIKLVDPLRSGMIFGYVFKNSYVGVPLIELLKDGKKHAITIETIVPDEIELGNECCVIKKLVSDSWLIK